MKLSGIRFGVQLEAGPIPHIVHQSKLSEKNGFDSIWSMDHYVEPLLPTAVYPELYTSMTVMAECTKRLVVGSAVTDMLRRHPSAIAQSTATVDHIAGGRTALGVGAGEAINLQPYGISLNRLCERMKEALQVVKLLWKADHTKPANFEGAFYQLRNAYLQIRPLKKPPPIYIGAYGPRMLEIAGELGDGWMPFAAHTPETYAQRLNGPIKRAAERAGRRLSDIEPAYITLGTVSKSLEEGAKTVVDWAKTFLIFAPECLKVVAPNLKHPGSQYTLAHSPRGPEEWKVITSMAAQVPTDPALKTAVYGTPDDCIAQIEKFAKAGCEHMIFYLLGKNVDEVNRLFGRKVFPYFKGKR